VAAFRATLEEVTEADLILHVRDIHHPDTEAQKTDVEAVLTELGLADEVEGGLVEVLNKIDLLDPETREQVRNQAARNRDVVAISAVTGEGCEALLGVVDRRVAGERQHVHLRVALEDGATIAWLYRHGEVLERRDDDTTAHLSVRLSAADLGRFRSRHAVH
jgi:GTP-binding protein HflX